MKKEQKKDEERTEEERGKYIKKRQNVVQHIFSAFHFLLFV